MQQRPYSNFVTNVSDDSQTSGVPSTERNYKQNGTHNHIRDSSSSPICCYSAVRKINNHKATLSAEAEQVIDDIDCVGAKYRDKKQVLRIQHSPTQFQPDAAVAAFATATADVDPGSAQCATSLRTNETHHQDVQTAPPNVSDQLINSRTSGKNRKFFCLDEKPCGEQCCCLNCVSECRNKLGFCSFCVYRERSQCRDYYHPQRYRYCADTNDIKSQCSTYSPSNNNNNNNNCALYKNRNSKESTICSASKGAIGSLAEIYSGAYDVHSLPTLCIDAFTSSPSPTWAENDKLPRESNDPTDLQPILKSNPQLKQFKHLACANRGHSGNCSDCIESLHKEPVVNHQDRGKVRGKFVRCHSRSNANVDCDKRLVFCTKRVTAQREVAKVFTIGLAATTDTLSSRLNRNIAGDSSSECNYCPKLGKYSKKSCGLPVKNLDRNRLTSVPDTSIAQPLLGHTLASQQIEQVPTSSNAEKYSNNKTNNSDRRSECECRGKRDWKAVVSDNPDRFNATDKVDIVNDLIRNDLSVEQPIDKQSSLQHLLKDPTISSQGPSIPASRIFTVLELDTQQQSESITKTHKLSGAGSDLSISEKQNLGPHMRNIFCHKFDNCHIQSKNNDCVTNSSEEYTISERNRTALTQEEKFYPNGRLRRRASFEYLTERSRENFEARHRRTNSSDATEYISVDRFSCLNRDCIAENLRLLQNTDHRYAKSLTAVSFGICTFSHIFCKVQENSDTTCVYFQSDIGMSRVLCACV